MKRAFDLTIVLVFTPVMLIVALVVGTLVKVTSPGPILYWSERVGRRNVLFWMPKFRTMYVNAPVVATDLLRDPQIYITPLGRWLRASSLDEIPQLWSVLVGRMSLVGPRPALYNQYDLIEKRTSFGIDEILPGLTGWAQVNGRDAVSFEEKVMLDTEYLKKRSLRFDLKILLLTGLKVLRGEGVVH